MKMLKSERRRTVIDEQASSVLLECMSYVSCQMPVFVRNCHSITHRSTTTWLFGGASDCWLVNLFSRASGRKQTIEQAAKRE